jgi:hypothetical protein
VRSERNITRHEHAWQVRVTRGSGDKKRVHSKVFSDGALGGKRKALAQARAFRDSLLAELPRLDRRAPAGWGYVRRTEKRQRVNTTAVWVAWIRGADGKARSTSFSIAVWGERGAKARAKKWLAERRSEIARGT